MRPLLVGVTLSMGLSLAPAKAASPTRYISDETVVTLRDGNGVDATVAALLSSGTRVELIEDDSGSGYARVRVAPGREGWVLARYLSLQPSARERLVAVETELLEQRALVATLETENQALRAAARTAPAAAASSGAVTPPGRWIGLFTGLGLVAAGLLAGLLMSLIGRGPRRKELPL